MSDAWDEDKFDELDYQCNYCDEEFDKVLPLARHVRLEHQDEIPKPFACHQSWCKEKFGKEKTRNRHSEMHCKGQCEKKACQVHHRPEKYWLCQDVRTKENRKKKIFPSKFFKSSNIVILRQGKMKCFDTKVEPFEIYCLKCKAWTNDLSDENYIHFDCEQITYREKTPLDIGYLINAYITTNHIYKQKMFNIFCFDCQKYVDLCQLNQQEKTINHSCNSEAGVVGSSSNGQNN